MGSEHQSGFIPREFGKYLLVEKIGSGGMAEIFKAVQRGAGNFQKVLVIKRILNTYCKDPNFIKMFLEEAKITAPLQHPNIVTIFEFDQIEGQYYIAMEFIHGRDLQRVMARTNKLAKRIPEEICLFIIGEVCKALWYAYNAKDPHGNPLKIIHRDVSPSNILISFDGHIKVTDFGVAKATMSESDAGRGTLKGKLGYMSPEQVLGKEIDHRSDIFALGIILFESLTLKRLFLGRTDLQTLINIRDADISKRLLKHPEIDPMVANILKRACAREPERRYATAKEMHGDIESYLLIKGYKVDAEAISRFMHDLYPTEAEQEVLPLDIDELTDPSKVSSKLRADLDVVDSGKFSLPTEDGEVKEVGRTARSRLSPSSTFFRVRDAEGHIFGPVSMTNFLSLLKSKAITEDEYCSINDGEWRRVGDVTQIQLELDAVRDEQKKRKILIEGSIDKKNIPRLIYDISREKSFSGLLTFKRGYDQKEIYFKSGRPKFIFSNLKSELLGEFLIKKNRVTREEIKRVLAEQKSSTGKLGDALVASGILKPHELAQILQEQFKERFLEIFSWDHGWYGLFEGVSAPERSVLQDLEPIQAIVDAIRTLFPLDYLKSILSEHQRRILYKNPNPKVDISEFSLTPREARIVNLIDNHPSLDALLRNLPQTPDNQVLVYRMVFLLLQTKIYFFKGLPRDFQF